MGEIHLQWRALTQAQHGRLQDQLGLLAQLLAQLYLLARHDVTVVQGPFSPYCPMVTSTHQLMVGFVITIVFPPRLCWLLRGFRVEGLHGALCEDVYGRGADWVTVHIQVI